MAGERADTPTDAGTTGHGVALDVGLAGGLAFVGSLLVLVGAQFLSDALPAGNRYRGNGALFLLVVGELVILAASWALLAFRLGRLRRPVLGSTATGAVVVLLALPLDLLAALGLPERLLFALPFLTALAGLGLARAVAPITLTLPPGLLAPLVVALVVGARARRHTTVWLAAGGVLVVPLGLIAGYIAGAALLATMPH
jgi:hypothetical protein